jgi:hypothetical protein
VGIEHVVVLPFLEEIRECGIPVAIEDGGLRNGVRFWGTTAPTREIIIGFRSAFQVRPAGRGHRTNTSV